MLEIFFIIAGILLRLIPHIPNVAPISAIALFGGTYLNKRYAIIIPLIAMFVSDIFLGFHASMPMVYTSFILTGLIGIWLRGHKTVYNIFFSSIASSTLFYLLTNFNYWYATPLYPKTFSGMMQAYYYALPFFRNTLVGDLFYTTVLFGSYALVTRFTTSLLRVKRSNL